jgi:hypothetical protein
LAQVQRRVLTFAALASFALLRAQPRFYPDDPVWKEPPPLSVGKIVPRKIIAVEDFLHQSHYPDRRNAGPAGAVNTLGEVPDSAWFTNRHARRPMTVDELKRGPGMDHQPVAPFTVVAARTGGITEDFRFRDASGGLYFIRPDPMSSPEMTTGAEMIGSRLFHALGYNVRERYLIYPRRSDLRIQPGASIAGLAGRRHRMGESHLDRLLRAVPRRKDGTWRLLAAYIDAGEPEGPFKFEGARPDDPNDIVPHENRRDLRGLHVLCAWLNHTEMKAQNTRDFIATGNGVRFIRHYLVNFSAILGSDADRPKDARAGYEYVLPKARTALARMAGFGILSAPWERAEHSGGRAIGRLEADLFDPETWKPNYPNPAFLSRDALDEYWAAKLVMSFSANDIRAIVDSAQFSRLETAEAITRILVDRRDKIGRTYFAKALPLDNFRVEDGELRFDDLGVLHRFDAPRRYEFRWNTFDNISGAHTGIEGASSARVPVVPRNTWLVVRISIAGEEKRNVQGYLKDEKVVGIDRE